VRQAGIGDEALFNIEGVDAQRAGDGDGDGGVLRVVRTLKRGPWLIRLAIARLGSSSVAITATWGADWSWKSRALEAT
jgi:hypothetical protein